MSKALCFLQITAKLQDCPFFTVSNHKNFIPIYLVDALPDFALTSRTSRRLLEEKAPVNDLEEQLPVPRYTAASTIGSSVISLLCQL